MLIVLTVASMAVAIVMSVVAWRASSEERRRSEARIAALAAEIHAPSTVDEAPLRASNPLPVDAEAPGVRPAAAEPSAAMFAATVQPAESGSRWGLALAAGAFVVASVGAAAIVFSGESPSAAVSAPAASPATAPVVEREALPLELVALGHEREGDRLTVRGVVRNPASGAQMDRLTAVVFLFDRDGAFLTSGRAAVASPALIPGGETTFVVTIPSASDVGRYRVSFRSDERIVSHVDKRSAS